ERHKQPHADAPHHPAESAEEIEHDGERELLAAPRPIQELVEPIALHALLDHELRRMREADVAVELLPEIPPPRVRVDEKRMAARVALRPVADVVQINNPERSRDADQHAEVNEKMLEP